MKRDHYFFSINVILLLIVLIGFAPSFYLRPLSNRASLPFYLIVHGVSCTAWFVIIVVQSQWIRKKQISKHRKFGTYFSLIAPILVGSGYLVLYRTIQLYHQQFAPIIEGMVVDKQQSFSALIITGDTIQLILFSAFVFLGYRFRTTFEVHKRAMLIASILICQQALVRIGKMEIFMLGENPGASGGIYATVIPLLMLVSMLFYDVKKYKKPQIMSIAGLLSYILFVASAFILNVTGLAVNAIEWMRG
ncbi:MAG: hypothetical protein AAF927_30270 [Bacteroidota bacterium]